MLVSEPRSVHDYLTTFAGVWALGGSDCGVQERLRGQHLIQLCLQCEGIQVGFQASFEKHVSASQSANGTSQDARFEVGVQASADANTNTN